MANRKKTGNIVSMKRRRSKTLGVILCLFSLYLLVMFIMSMTKDHLSIYEVNETQIADDETIRGLILRDEVLVNTQKAGYINYYVGEGDRVGLQYKCIFSRWNRRHCTEIVGDGYWKCGA